MSEFSVIIPTLQRAKELHELVEMCAAHPRVLEVLVINNAPEPLHWGSPKVRLLQQAENIYVNPAWNLGAREARGKFLAIINDDVLFDPGLLDLAARGLQRRGVGLIGIGPGSLRQDEGKPRLVPTFTRTPGYGVALFLRRERWTPIPEDMLIWYGDDWVFTRQRQLNWAVEGLPVRTDMSVTSSDAKFSPLLEADRLAAQKHGDADYYRRMRVRRAVARILTRVTPNGCR